MKNNLLKQFNSVGLVLKILKSPMGNQRANKDLSKIKPIYPIRDKEIFIRGCVRHKDHKTIKYTHWHQVILNNEGATSSATQSWID